MADSTDSKTEKATPKKRKDERKKGNVFSSRDIVTVMSVIIVFSVIRLMFPSIYARIDEFFTKCIDYAAETDVLSRTFLNELSQQTLILLALTILPILFISMLVGIVATGAQTKFNFSQDALKPKFNRLNPIEGFKKMLSLRSLIEIIKGLIKIIIIGVIIYRFFLSRITPLTKTLYMDLDQAAAYILDSVLMLVFNIGVIFVFVAALDYLYQRWDYERKIKMSKHDIKEEYKQVEGDPKVKQRIKEVQRKFALSRMMQAVPTADVIIKNPTHYAVALRYDVSRDMAPILVAKGQDELALRIVRVAEENGVYVTENKPLAQALFATVELEREIPLEFYNTVAEILAVIYKEKNKTL